jgi:hypothetical protein
MLNGEMSKNAYFEVSVTVFLSPCCIALEIFNIEIKGVFLKYTNKV